MTNKPTTAAGYEPDNLGDVYSTCLYLATRFGDFLDDIVVVGGLVPSLLVNQSELIWDTDSHAGTLDLDLGLALALLDEERYQNFDERLQEAGLAPDLSESGNPSHQRWRATFNPSVTIDFLIPPSADDDEGGRLRHILRGFRPSLLPDFIRLSVTVRGWHSRGALPWARRPSEKYGCADPERSRC